MAAKFTRKYVEARFDRTAEALGWITNTREIGSKHLDYAPIYGGYDINEIVNEGGAIRQVNGWCNRLKAAEMVAFLDGLEMGVKLMNDQHLLEIGAYRPTRPEDGFAEDGLVPVARYGK